MSSLRRRFLALAFLSVLGGCELDFTGVGDAIAIGFCGGPCVYAGPSVPTLAASGTVRIGDYPAMYWETRILLYAEGDTLSPVDSIWTSALASWVKDFGPSPQPAVCSYLARAVLWNGERTALEPLFRSPPQPCQPTSIAFPGVDFRLPAYAPLPQPLGVTGRVLIDGAPATAGAATVRVYLRHLEGGTRAQALPIDEQGVYRFETTDGAQWFALCQGATVQVEVSVGALLDRASLNPIRDASCSRTRDMPDVRIGTRKAAWGTVSVRNSDGSGGRYVGMGAARVVLLNPVDSTVVGAEVETHDDGSFQVWFPHELSSPGCNWLLRAELESGGFEIRPLPPAWMTSCQENLYHRFTLDAPAP